MRATEKKIGGAHNAHGSQAMRGPVQALILLYRDEPMRDFPIGSRPLQIGSAPGCDIVVHDPAVAPHHMLVRCEGGVVRAYDLRRTAADSHELLPLKPGVRLPVGEWHALQLVEDAPTRPRLITGRTEPIVVRDEPSARLTLLVGRGSEARRVAIGRRPITIGAARDCDVVLYDRTVSSVHCRIEPADDDEIWVRDLESRNGTWVDGVRVEIGRLVSGTRLTLGRTELRAVGRGDHGALHGGIVAASPAMHEVLEDVERFAQLAIPVLIEGESGVGKEGLAHALHTRGTRRAGPWVSVNAGGLPRDLVESELFGHEKGAFTGAQATRRGVFELAHTGTLFLDEIGELPLDLQARLLRVLETWEVRRVGGESATRVDVRLVCATHRDLRAQVSAGRFREDLYYRIRRLVVSVPPLRERLEDVRALALHFLGRVREEIGPRQLTYAALDRLAAYAWPGNARELRNVIESAAARASGPIDVPEIERAIVAYAGRDALVHTSDVVELLQRHGGNLSAAARAAGVPRSTLKDRLAEAGVRRAPKRSKS